MAAAPTAVSQGKYCAVPELRHDPDGVPVALKMPNPNFMLAILSAHFPRFVCVPCLALVMINEETEVAVLVIEHVQRGTVETRTEGDPCVICGRPAFVVRVTASDAVR